jgi:hypothetical protein
MAQRSELILNCQSRIDSVLYFTLNTEIIHHLSPHSFTYNTIYYSKHACTDLSTSSIRASMLSRCVSSPTPHNWQKLTSRWSKEDHEVFDLVSALEQAEGIPSFLPGLAPTDDPGKGVDFYSHLGIDSSATLNQLNKASRKKSLELQYVQLSSPVRIGKS